MEVMFRRLNQQDKVLRDEGMAGLKHNSVLAKSLRGWKDDNATSWGAREDWEELEIWAEKQPIPFHTSLREINLKPLLILKL